MIEWGVLEKTQKTRLKRFAKQSFHLYLEELIGPFWERGQLLALFQAVFATYLILQTASIAEVIDEISSWWIAAQAFVWVSLGWAALCLIRAPLLAIKQERRRGSWHGSRFTYRVPELAATIRCKATGQPQFYKFFIETAEPNSFVYCRIETEGAPPRNLFTATVVGGVVLRGMMTEPGQGVIDSSTRIGPDKSAELLVVMSENMVSQTFRIYINGFNVGEPMEQDGDEGEFREPFRRTVEGDDRG